VGEDLLFISFPGRSGLASVLLLLLLHRRDYSMRGIGGRRVGTTSVRGIVRHSRRQEGMLTRWTVMGGTCRTLGQNESGQTDFGTIGISMPLSVILSSSAKEPLDLTAAGSGTLPTVVTRGINLESSCDQASQSEECTVIVSHLPISHGACQS
jgi:hypothetical protein